MIAATATSPQTPGLALRGASAGWLQSLSDWPAAAMRSLQREHSVARILVADVRGSAPREAGACMLVERTCTFGTIGGGRLEWAAVASAREVLCDPGGPAARVERLVLGPELAQCCGGVVVLWIERYTRSDLSMLANVVEAMRSGDSLLVSQLDSGRVSRHVAREPTPARVRVVRTSVGSVEVRERLGDTEPDLWLFGAGHVGQALVRTLSDVPVRITWIDSRTELLPADVPVRVRTLCRAEPLRSVDEAPNGTHFLVMTHSHPLDYDLCRAILLREDFAWAGVIGSRSKSARFRSQLARDGLSAAQIARLTCPIGIDGIDSKSPGVIAVAVAAQLLQTFESAARAPAASTGLPAASAGCVARDLSHTACASCGFSPSVPQ